MKKKYVLFLMFIAIVLMIVPFRIPSEAKDTISVGANLVSTLASLVTLLIAVLLYSKYGIEKSLMVKQMEIVLHFLVELKRTTFIISDKRSVLFLSLDRINRKYWENYKDREMLFDRSYLKGLTPIWEKTENLLFPEEIAEKLMTLTVEVITSCSIEDRHMIVKAKGYSKGDGTDIIGTINNKPMILSEYIGLWKNVISVSLEWLSNHSSAKDSFSFYRIE